MARPQPATAPATDETAASATTLDRRQFLIRMGGATATLTLAGGVLGRLAEQAARVTEVALSETLATTLPPEIIAQLPPVTYTAGTIAALQTGRRYAPGIYTPG